MTLLGLLVAAVGCTHHRPAPPLDPVRPAAWQPAEQTKPIAARPQAPSGPIVQAAAVEPADPLAAPEPVPLRRPQHVLVMSGGGSYGAFSAGLLNGWSKSGTRPEFDVVTGVSTGALISPLAFLGSKHDDDMRRLYTEIRQRDIYIMRAWATLPFRDALASSAPLRRIVETTLSPGLIDALAVEHRKGRRLYVGTTNLDARRFIVWDLGAIAAKGGPDSRKLIIDILLASSAVPGMFPPVAIDVEVDGKAYTEMHVDGGVSSPLFLPTGVLDAVAAKAGPAPAPPANVYVLAAGKFYADPAPVRSRVLKVLGASAGAYYHGHLRAETANLYHAVSHAHAKFHVASVRQDFPIADTGIEFDQESMTKLFADGAKIGSAGPSWDKAPPERAPGDGVPIRTGTRFRTKP